MSNGRECERGGVAVMTLRLLSYIELPPHRSKGGFDHADIHLPTARLYVAHTANDAVDVIDIDHGIIPRIR